MTTAHIKPKRTFKTLFCYYGSKVRTGKDPEGSLTEPKVQGLSQGPYGVTCRVCTQGLLQGFSLHVPVEGMISNRLDEREELHEGLVGFIKGLLQGGWQGGFQ